MNDQQAIAVLGAGSWGTALAMVLARNGAAVTLWGRDEDQMRTLKKQGENELYLPGYQFPENLSVTHNLAGLTETHRQFLVVVPSRAFRQVLEMLSTCGLSSASMVTWGTKGFDPTSGGLLSEVVDDVLGPSIRTAVVSGPSFANEVAASLPTALTVASEDMPAADELAAMLRNDRMRVYTNGDPVGVQVGGAVKNVIAVATGISDGLGFGANTRAALITRGLVEISRLGASMGAEPTTMMGLAGLGDLVLTCTDDQSRNRRLGLGLGTGKLVSEIQQEIGQEVESIVTARELHELARKRNIDMPIADQVYNVLYNNCTPREAVQVLLNRDPTRE